MYPFLIRAHGAHTTSLSSYSHLIDHCLSLKSLAFSKFIHAQLVKVGFNTHTFLGNRFLDLYSKFGTMNNALQAFEDIPVKNSITWNVLLRAFFKFGHLESARNLFDSMPERDVVSWNSMISGYASNGFADNALGLFSEMQSVGVRPSGFTFSIAMSCVSSAHHGKQIHGSMIRSGLNLSNVVLGNALIAMYGKLRLVDYAFDVFFTMEELDLISWNTLISGCNNSGYSELALNLFCLVRSAGNSLDQFTISTVITVCSNLRDLEKGKQVFALCIRMGFLSNSIVSSATIDMFSKCDRLEDSVRLFEEIDRWDSALCNSMILCYARHGLKEDALQLFVLTVRQNFRPTEFTLSSVLSSASGLLPVEQGTQIHSLVLKLGLESDTIVSSSLVDMYTKSGLIDSALKIFAKIGIRDLVSWNTMILGFTRNGRAVDALEIFKELLERGPAPDRITLTGVLFACSYGGFIDEGRSIFSSMEKKYGVIPEPEHYACIVYMMVRAGKLTEAMEIIETMPHERSGLVWGSMLRACGIHADLKLTERVAERVMELEPQSSLPYLVLAQMYGMRGRWESMSRVRKAMKERGVKKVTGSSWIGIKNYVYVFKANQILHYGGESIYSILRLLIWEMEDQGYVYQQYDEVVRDGGED
ncbi:hypothetical protein HHK36_004274 [Tetracentron sinense]|uniref:Pentatricopeptide repeat-containing protein n=1 Tax=Tetracentron sinense TaxID=13715 RepID=A0A834ZQV4_TETSI|nr:hypothetical protein HHK36_004274 [Tetracentron sinense]